MFLLLTDLDSYRSFLNLGQTPGVNSVILPSELMSTSTEISIPGGFPLGSSVQNTIYVRLEWYLIVKKTCKNSYLH